MNKKLNVPNGRFYFRPQDCKDEFFSRLAECKYFSVNDDHAKYRNPVTEACFSLTWHNGARFPLELNLPVCCPSFKAEETAILLEQMRLDMMERDTVHNVIPIPFDKERWIAKWEARRKDFYPYRDLASTWGVAPPAQYMPKADLDAVWRWNYAVSGDSLTKRYAGQHGLHGLTRIFLTDSEPVETTVLLRLGAPVLFPEVKNIFFGTQCANYYLRMKTIKKLLYKIDDPDFGILYCLSMTSWRALLLTPFLKFAPQKEFKSLRMDKIDDFIPESGKGVGK